ncbi:MAG: DUF1549 domain-containing protein [Planctomycetota bacterium JB042]
MRAALSAAVGLLVAGALVPTAPGGVRALRLDPPRIELSSADDRQTVVVQATLDDGRTLDVTDRARLRLDDPRPAALVDQTVTPLVDGRTSLTASYGGRSATVPITVTAAHLRRDVFFRSDVLPALTASGCNTGTCHGSARGQDGFGLSLFGFDPDGDQRRITLEQGSRRVHPAAPDESLLLKKALGAVPHTGGRLLDERSPRYETIRRWIAEGARPDPDDVAVTTALDLHPPGAVLDAAGGRQRFVLVARLSDGSTRDVTRDAVWFSRDPACAAVSADGEVRAVRRGESHVTARYATFTVGVPILVVPAETARGASDALPPRATDPFDALVLEKLARLRVRPAPRCDDETFVRRVHLDLIGLPPTVDERAAFLADPRDDRRARLVDRLLAREEFVDLWVMEWSDMLGIRSDLPRNLSPKAMLRYGEWLEERLRADTPIDVLVRELLTADGSTLADPPANFYQVEPDPLKLAENVAQSFLGMRLQCAQCHNHPFDRWTMDDYYGFAAFFAQVGRKSGAEPRESIVFDRGAGDVKHPVGGATVHPRFLGGAPADVEGKDRRRVLAEWLTDGENPYFARSLVNRIWARFLGVGIVEPVDDFRVSNPPSNEPLLDALAASFVESGYDLRALVRRICLTDAYQRSTVADETNALDERNFARRHPRRLRAEVLLDTICRVTETTPKFAGLPKGLRAVELQDGADTNEFLLTFGRPVRTTVCACDVVLEPNLSQALLLLNGSDVGARIAEGDLPRRLLAEGRSPEEALEELYLRCLGRLPDDAERAALLATVRDAQPDHEAHLALEDVLWALLNSKEFLFNH